VRVGDVRPNKRKNVGKQELTDERTSEIEVHVTTRKAGGQGDKFTLGRQFVCGPNTGGVNEEGHPEKEE